MIEEDIYRSRLEVIRMRINQSEPSCDEGEYALVEVELARLQCALAVSRLCVAIVVEPDDAKRTVEFALESHRERVRWVHPRHG